MITLLQLIILLLYIVFAILVQISTNVVFFIFLSRPYQHFSWVITLS